MGERIKRRNVLNKNGDTMPGPEFEIYPDASGKYRFRLKAPNGEIIAVSESYSSKAACENGIESVKKNAPIAGKRETKK